MNYLEDIGRATRQNRRHTFTAEEIKRFARPTIRSRSTSTKSGGEARISARLRVRLAHGAVCMRLMVDRNAQADGRRRSGEAGGRSHGPSPAFATSNGSSRSMSATRSAYASEAIETRPIASGPDWGLVSRYTGTNQHGDLVFSFIGSIFVERRAPLTA